MYLGKVISTFDGPTPTVFKFVVANSLVRKNQFVELDITGDKAIAMVSDVMKTNRYFERADSVQHFEKTGTDISERFPTTDWEYLVGICRILGVYRDGLLKRPTLPPSPGTKVLSAGNDLLKKFLGLVDDGLNIGSVEHHDVPVNLDVTRLFQKHLAILAQSGAGKSYFVSTLIEELLDKKTPGRPALVVIDVHGEYTSFAEDENYRSKCAIVNGAEFKIPVSSLSASYFSVFLPDMTGPQKRELSRVIAEMHRDMKEGNGPFDLRDVMKKIEDDPNMNELVAQALTAWLHNLDSLRLFAKVGSPNIGSLAKPGKLAVIDLSDIIDLRRKQIVVAFAARELFKKRRRGKVPPFILFVEEAHNFAREGMSASESLAKGIIETIAREGRKFGASLCLISQRPIQLSTTALSQCNTHCILRITNPYDIDHIGKSSEGLDKSSLDSITTLRVGEALILGEAVNFPLFMKIRRRRSKDLKLGGNFEVMAADFEKRAAQHTEDAAAFM